MGRRKGIVAAVVDSVTGWNSKAKSRSQAEREYDSANPAHCDRAEQALPSLPTRSNTNAASFNTRSPSARSTFSYGSVNYFGLPDGVPRLIHSSPERRRSRDSVALLNRVPEEEDTMDREHEEESRYTGGAPLDYEESESEEEVWELDEELADRGLYRGSYKRLVALYTLTPFTTLVTLILLAVLPPIIYPIKQPSSYPYAPYLPFPIPEVLAAMAMWSLAYLIHSPLYALASAMSSSCHLFSSFVESLLAVTLQSTSAILFRLISIPILLIPHYAAYDYPTWEDNTFRRVWWVSLGWAAAEAVVGIAQGYKSIALYKEVLVTIRKTPTDSTLNPTHAAEVHKSDPELTPTTIHPAQRSRSESLSTPTIPSGSSSRQEHGSIVDANAQTAAEGERQPLLPRKLTTDSERQELLLRTALEMEVERDLDQLIALKRREDIEDAYGMPFIHIPVFISCLHRINALLSSLGVTLLLSAAYMRSTFAEYTPPAIPYLFNTRTSFAVHITSTKSNTYLAVTVPVVLVLQVFLSLLHTPLVLPRVGVHTFVYLGLLISLGMLFSGLSVWKALS
ncbi:hypothetical protein BDQ17DRAFT_1543515 [Cyathus striatus]|nr:hypothetical protein BDQ17DRAFT_1543515 [Cyathus striatus]